MLLLISRKKLNVQQQIIKARQIMMDPGGAIKIFLKYQKQQKEMLITYFYV